ncbi:peptidylprolyl isomerase [Sandaracinobacter sp. RS1-74]|uniref:peptidylprolyl isomerase n=1 Tax=Sandaracinobacteroides sayramensis TaxID=2913411 RepID=UPI001EDBB6CF|nr:peptidylprolyl isomerase [Sandaracinobacteroides sayramensis]MCG2841932.1 peptidylprolyl isomerase [Sandaracinobacteroides sayramensis]
MIRNALAAALLLTAAPAFAQETPAVPVAPEQPAPQYQTAKVRLETADGPIVIAVETERAPVTSANFLKYVEQKKFDGTSFYRALNFPGRPDLGLVQGGAKSDPKRMLPPIAHEPTTKTGLSHKEGAVSMARGAPGSAQGDFFIILGDLSTLDANPAAQGDNAGFAVFGHVVEGMDVVKKILAAPVSATEGAGAMKGQMIEKPVPIRSARRLPE